MCPVNVFRECIANTKKYWTCKHRLALWNPVDLVTNIVKQSFSCLNFSIFGVPKIFLSMLPRFIDSFAYDSRQKLDNVNRTLLVLASDKLVQQKYHIYRKNHFIALATESSNKREKMIFRSTFGSCLKASRLMVEGQEEEKTVGNNNKGKKGVKTTLLLLL